MTNQSEGEAIMNMLAHISANHDQIKAGVIAFVMKPTEGQPSPAVEILTIGDDAVHIFGIGELVKMQLFSKLEGDR